MAEGFFDSFEKGGDADGFIKTVTRLDGIAYGKESSGAGVDEDHALLLVDGDDAFDHGVEDGGQQID